MKSRREAYEMMQARMARVEAARRQAENHCLVWLDPNHLFDGLEYQAWAPLPPIECRLEAGHLGRHEAYE